MSDDGWGAYFPAAETVDVPGEYVAEDYTERPAAIERPAADRAKTGPNQATEIVQLARSRYNVVRGDDGKTYAVAHAQPGVAFAIRGTGGLRQQLAAAYYNDKGRAASAGAIGDALAVLEGDAQQTAETRVHLRVGEHSGAIIVDRATPAGNCIRIDGTGWALVERPPILFRRSAVSSAMPAPTHGGTLDGLRALMNVDEARFRLLVGYIVAAYLPDIAHPILALTGQQGTAKTTAARIILSFVDPSAASLQSQPQTPADWAVAAYNVYGVGLDNVSRLPAWLQDALCKAVTGDAFVRRELYSDDGLVTLTYRRPIALTTIDPGALQGDVADRLLPIELLPISPADRRTEAEVRDAVETLRAGTLGALFDILAGILRVMPTVKLDEKPRMADFALVLAALDQITGWSTLTDYLAATVTAARDVLDGDSFASALVSMVIARGQWAGTCLELLGALGNDKHPRDWPESPRGVAARLARITPALAAGGVEVMRRAERTQHGAIYQLTDTTSPLCSVCGNALPRTLAHFTAHPTCTPTLPAEEPF